MTIAARWIRLHPPALPALRTSCLGFARVQPEAAAPAALWAGLGEGRHALSLVAPLKYVPGRSTRWRAWALAPLIATYRQCGLSAYTDADRICLSGQPITDVSAAETGACAVITADFMAWGVNFMELLRVRVEAQYGWQFDNSWPAPHEQHAIEGALAGDAARAR
jgi:hypothetical protein